MLTFSVVICMPEVSATPCSDRVKKYDPGWLMTIGNAPFHPTGGIGLRGSTCGSVPVADGAPGGSSGPPRTTLGHRGDDEERKYAGDKPACAVDGGVHGGILLITCENAIVRVMFAAACQEAPGAITAGIHSRHRAADNLGVEDP